MIYVKEKYSKYICHLSESSIVGKDVEVLTLYLQYPNMRKLQLSAIYRPPTGSRVKYIDFLRGIIHDVNLLKVDVLISIARCPPGFDFRTTSVYYVGLCE